MIKATLKGRSLHKNGATPPTIGQEVFYFEQSHRNSSISNSASQTLSLMPDGSVCLPDYKNGYEEFMHPFGNIISSSFEEILSGSGRIKYLTKQLTRNSNMECL